MSSSDPHSSTPSEYPPPHQPPKEISWETLDHRKFFLNGAALFSLTTVTLYPLSVIKTHQMTSLQSSTSLHSTLQSPQQSPKLPQIHTTAHNIYSQFGMRGFYKGIGTVLLGALPARLLYLNTLEFIKALTTQKLFHASVYSSTRKNETKSTYEIQSAAISSLFAGAVASLVTQSVTVPIDVISQRLIVQSKTDSRYKNGFQCAKYIVQHEGIFRGLYRGYFLSVATFVPSSALWWSAYHAYQKLAWNLISSSSNALSGIKSEAWVDVGVQVGCAVGAGMSSSLVTTPLDVVKVRVQVQELDGKLGIQEREKVRVKYVLKELLREDGIRGLFRGVVPRMANAKSIRNPKSISTK